AIASEVRAASRNSADPGNGKRTSRRRELLLRAARTWMSLRPRLTDGKSRRARHFGGCEARIAMQVIQEHPSGVGAPEEPLAHQCGGNAEDTARNGLFSIVAYRALDVRIIETRIGVG